VRKLADKVAQLGAKPRLRHDWRRVLKHAWSVRFSLLAAVLSGVEAGGNLLASAPPFSITLYAALMCIITIAAALARLVAQSKLTPGAE
jgi:hypothetical protein